MTVDKYERANRYLVRKYPDALSGDTRQGRALKLAKAGMVKRIEGKKFQVHSQSSNTVYEVDLEAKTCNCPDAEKGFICKHRRAAAIVLVAMGVAL